MKLLALLLIALPAFADDEPAFYRDLAAHHAPVLYQETGEVPRADSITRFDFDGDLDGANNWDDVMTSPVPGYVYYSVVESRTHYFITYGFFHARDYSHVCVPVICHENDYEGAILTVKKSSRSPYGEVILAESLAHFEIHSAFHPNTAMDPVSGEPRVAFFIERMGHGVHPMTPDRAIDPAHLLLYSYGGTAENPAGASFGKVKYDLLPIKAELWDRRTMVGPQSLFGDTKPYNGRRFSWPLLPFEFNGAKFHGIDKPQPPWAWGAPLGSGFATGEWFLDPALVVARHPEIDMSRFSLEYVYNPFMP